VIDWDPVNDRVTLKYFEGIVPEENDSPYEPTGALPEVRQTLDEFLKTFGTLALENDAHANLLSAQVSGSANFL
jgi:hypothetical protein